MNKLFLILVFLFCFFSVTVTSQIIIGPEAGIYYRPYTLRGIANSIEKKELDYYLGIIGEVKLISKMYAQSHIAYIFRHRTEAASEIHTHLPNLKSGLFINREMNFNIDILYEPIKNSKIGFGFGMIHKLDSEVQENYFYKNTISSYFSPGAFYNTSFVINQNFGRFGLNARYFYSFKSENLESNHFRILNDKSGFTLGFHYKLFGYTKK